MASGHSFPIHINLLSLHLIAHGMILDKRNENRPTSNTSNTALVVKAINRCTNPNCKAKKCSTHTTANCYWPVRGKKGQFPPNFGQRVKVSVVNSSPQTHETTEHFVLSAPANTQDGTPGPVVTEDDHGITIADIAKVEDEIVIETNTEDEEEPIIEVTNGLVDANENRPVGFVSKGFASFGGGISMFMDSGASDTMFVSRDVFIEY